jgi:glucokinase
MPTSVVGLPDASCDVPWAAMDLGASKIAAMYCRDGKIVSHRAAVAPGDPASSWARLEATLREWGATAAPAGICVTALAPTVDADGVITHWPMRADWVGRNMRHLLSRVTGAEEVVFLDDGAAAALAECRAGPYDSAVVLVAGTGLASGVVIDGKLFRGSGRGGQIGHLIAYRPGTPCPCGQQGCLQTMLSAPAMLAVAGRHRGGQVTWPQWAAAWSAGRRWASRAAASVSAELAIAAVNTTAAFDVPLAVLTGRPFETFPGLVPCVANASRQIAPGRDPFIMAGRLGAEAPLSGAAVLARELAGYNATNDRNRLLFG